MSNLQTINVKSFVKVNDKEINNILIYNDGEVLFDFRRAEILKFPSKFSWDKLAEITIEEVKLAKKLNLNRKDNFIIINKTHNYFKEQRYDLYINSKDVRVENKREEKYMELEDRIEYIPVADLYFTHVAKEFMKTREGEVCIEYDSNKPFVSKECQITRSELTELGKEIKALELKFKELRINVPSYDLKALVKNFNITEREK